MRGLLVKAALVLFVCTTFAGLAAAQGSYATVHGVVKDATGAPVADAQVLWENTENGRHYKLKTNKKGEYFSLGVDPGDYNITVTSKDGKVLDKVNKFHAGLGDVTQDFDLKQSQETSIKETAKKAGVSNEQMRQQVQQQQAEAEKVQKYNENLKAVNEKLNAGAAFMKAQPPDYAQAIAAYQEAANMVPDEDIPWYRLGNAYLASARTQTDPAERSKQYNEAYNDLQKAVDLLSKKQPPAGQAPPPAAGAKGQQAPSNNEHLAYYYDNLGAAAAQLGKMDEATKSYEQAIQLDPAHAGDYYFRLGVVLHNNAKDEETRKKAVEAFDKAIAADPNKADAYYLKGTDLFAQVSTDSAGKIIAPPGTAEALQKYVDLQPTGPHAEEAKQMLAALNATVESSFGKKTTAPAKKK